MQKTRIGLTVLLVIAVLPVCAQGLVVEDVQLIDGREDMIFVNVLLADLDAGDLVGGNTVWDHDGDNVFFIETQVGFVWNPIDGATPFAISEDLYFNDARQLVYDLGADGTAVGIHVFKLARTSWPFRFTVFDGIEFLERPAFGYAGSANAVSDDGTIVAGWVREANGLPTRAVVWNSGALSFLPSDRPWSDALDTSDDGSVIVGWTGFSDLQVRPARWVNGVREDLRAVGVASRAQFVSDDGTVVVGLTTLRQGAQALVHWEGNRRRVFRPPMKLSIVDLFAINADASAAVGSVADVTGNRAPFVWRLGDGFTVIPELGRDEDYDLSQAVDVSDDGNTVIGTIQNTVVSNGDPPTTAFVWTPEEGTVAINDLLADFGIADPDFFIGIAVSGDGRKIVATGNPERTNNDANSLLIRFAPR